MHYAVFSEDEYYLYYRNAEFSGVDTIFILPYAVILWGGYFLCYVLQSIFEGRMLFILCTTQYFSWVYIFFYMEIQYFPGVDNIYAMHYAIYLGGGYYLHYALRSIFEGWILFILWTTQYFRGVDTIHSMDYAFFSEDGYYINYALRRFPGVGYYLYNALCRFQGGG